MLVRPQPNEAASYYSKYIDLVAGDDILAALKRQAQETAAFLATISEEKSLHRYGPDKWTIREVLNHVNDCERIFLFRAFWFGRGFTEPLPGFDQDVCVRAAEANDVSWADHVAEFHAIRLTSVSLFDNLPDQAWSRTGTANDTPFTVRALAYIIAGHVSHHASVIKERYL
jgi:DinB superfamily